jgi:hypothetical protein
LGEVYQSSVRRGAFIFSGNLSVITQLRLEKAISLRNNLLPLQLNPPLSNPPSQPSPAFAAQRRQTHRTIIAVVFHPLSPMHFIAIGVLLPNGSINQYTVYT